MLPLLALLLTNPDTLPPGPLFVIPLEQPGQQFLYIGSDALPVLKDKNGVVAATDMGLKVLTLESITNENSTPRKAVFKVEGRRYPVVADVSGSLLAAPWLAAIVRDEAASVLRMELVGRHWWIPGEAVRLLHAPDEGTHNVRIGAGRVRNVVRLVSFRQDPFGWLDVNTNPLVVLFEQPVGGRFEFRTPNWYSSPHYTTQSLQPKTELPIYVAEETPEELRAWFSTVDRARTFAKDPVFGKDFVKLKVSPGMPREMVLWILGPPQGDWSPKAPVWSYRMFAPFSYVVRFKNGKVAKAGVEGDLP